MRVITSSEQANLATIERAAARDDLGLVVVTERATGLERVALATIGFDGTKYTISPFALMIDGNPFELLDPPSV